MTQYDAGPGDWSDREWESPGNKPGPQAKRRFSLPPWLLVVALVAVVLVLCVGLVLILQAQARHKRAAHATPTGLAGEQSAVVEPTATFPLVEGATSAITPTATVVLPVGPTGEQTAFTEIAIGAPVVVTANPSLTLRAEPSTSSTALGQLKNGTALIVLDGPQKAGGYTWWKVRRADGTGKDGWAAGEFLKLKANQ